MLELIETTAVASGSIPETRRLDARAFEEPRDPSLDRRTQLDLPAVDEQPNLSAILTGFRGRAPIYCFKARFSL
jgi:hypothetical protein